MQWIDWLLVGMFSIAILTAILKARHQTRNGCSGCGCAGCNKACIYHKEK